jgi:hypothetical protein
LLKPEKVKGKNSRISGMSLRFPPAHLKNGFGLIGISSRFEVCIVFFFVLILSPT